MRLDVAEPRWLNPGMRFKAGTGRCARIAFRKSSPGQVSDIPAPRLAPTRRLMREAVTISVAFGDTSSIKEEEGDHACR